MSEKEDIQATLTPTEDLILEVLIARHRLGEPFWPVSTRSQKAINSLAEKGLVTDYGSAVEGCVRVGLTIKAKAYWCNPDTYVPPIFRDKPRRFERWRELQALLWTGE